jgi:hypothetical protein
MLEMKFAQVARQGIAGAPTFNTSGIIVCPERVWVGDIWRARDFLVLPDTIG